MENSKDTKGAPEVEREAPATMPEILYGPATHVTWTPDHTPKEQRRQVVLVDAEQFAAWQRTQSAGVPDALREAVEYLDDNPFNEIGAGSILHRAMRDALAAAPAQPAAHDRGEVQRLREALAETKEQSETRWAGYVRESNLRREIEAERDAMRAELARWERSFRDIHEPALREAHAYIQELRAELEAIKARGDT